MIKHQPTQIKPLRYL